MLRKKNKKAIFYLVDDERRIVYDFRLRSTKIGFESYRTVDYRVYPQLSEEEMLPKLDEHLEKLCAGAIDDGNGDVLDSILFSVLREAMHNLNRQRFDHQDMIKRLAIRREADRKDIQRLKERREAECHQLEEEYVTICKKKEAYERGVNYEKRRERIAEG